MASSAQQEAPAGIHRPSADIVGNVFVHQFYHILHQSPEHVHQFYHDDSKLGRPELNGVMSTTTTMQAINDKIISLEYQGIHAEISTVDAQESYNGGILVLVTGYLIGKDNLRQKFSQTFFLAPQDNGYFVLNDVFRYVEDAKPFNEMQVPVIVVEAPFTHPAPTQDLSLQEDHFTEQPVVSDKVNEDEPSYPSENVEVQTVEQEALISEVVDEIPNALETVQSNTKFEEAPKKSYASIVSSPVVKVMKENSATLLTPVPAVVRSVAKSIEQQLPPVYSPPLPETPASNVNVTENGNNQDGEVNSCSIYIRGMPLSTTHNLIENEFRKFGPIKSGGIQVRSQKGACFGFVEFEVASAVQSAIEASPITIGGRQVVVEEKRSTGRGYRGRFSSGRVGGFRNDGPRGNYGVGRGRVESNNRNEFGNRGNGRGGFSNRGGDRFHSQRADNMGSNGGRPNRAGGMNAAAESMPHQVPASA